MGTIHLAFELEIKFTENFKQEQQQIFSIQCILS